jgi:integrase
MHGACVEQDDKGWDARKRAYCLKIQPATGSFARNLIYSTKPSRWYSFRHRLARSAPGNVFRHKPHDLRATFATHFLRSALSCYPDQAANALGTVKYWMGHKSENTTMKYIVFLQQNQISDAVAGVMDALIDGAAGRDGAIYEPE